MSPQTSFTSFATPIPAGIPSEPLALRFTGVPANGQASIAFTAPLVDGGTPILDYQITATPTVSGSVITSVVSDTAATLTLGMTGTFVIVVRARNFNGISPPSGGIAFNAADLIAPAAMAPAPTNVVATSGNGSLSFSFTPPDNASGVGVTSYRVTCISDIPSLSAIGLNPFTPKSATGTSSPLIVTGLTGDINRCHVTNLGSGGGASTPNVYARALGARWLPDKPSVTAVTAGSGLIAVAFLAPAATGISGISDYQVQCYVGGTTTLARPTMRSTTSPITVSGLANDTAYDCDVRATNVVPVSTVSGVGVGEPAYFSATPSAQGGSGSGGTAFSGITATGSGQATLQLPALCVNCVISRAKLVAATGAVDSPSVPPPAGVSFPHGLVDFQVSGVPTGGTITVTLTYPFAIPTDAVFWKFGPTLSNPAASWYQYPATITGNTLSYQLTDGGVGDGDLTADGRISDPAGLSIPLTPILNVDDSTDAATKYDAATDGVLIIRYLMGFRDEALIQNARGATAKRDAAAIASHLASVLSALDVDGDGLTKALTDGLLILRRMLGLQGAALTNGANKGSRTDSEIAAAIDALKP